MEIMRIGSGNGCFSAAALAGGLIFISGQYGGSDNRDITGQARELLEKCDQILAQCGSDRRHVLFAAIYLNDIHNTLADFNAVWKAWVEPGFEPARTCVGTQIAYPGYFAEVSFVAVPAG